MYKSPEAMVSLYFSQENPDPAGTHMDEREEKRRRILDDILNGISRIEPIPHNDPHIIREPNGWGVRLPISDA